MSEDPKSAPAPHSGEPSTSQTGDPYGYYEDPYGSAPPISPPVETLPAVPAKVPPRNPPPPASSGDDGDGGDDDDGMLRMSFLEHLEELRSRIIKALMGLGIAFVGAIIFANELWRIVSEPATTALHHLGFEEKLAQITPMETFSTVWVKLPMLASIFIASPWILYQVWGFIAPGLYKKERRWAAPFVLCSAGLFIAGGLFAYYVAFRYGLEFLLGIGRDINIKPVVSVTEYFDLFVNVTLGVALVFEMPILIFFLTLLRIASPSFLMKNSRYAILAIVIIAAIVTPTPDVFNLMMFAVPMCALFFVGVFAGYILVLHREQRRFPWIATLGVLLALLAVGAGCVWLAIAKFGFHTVNHWPYLLK